MSGIWIDPTEARAKSRLPANVQAKSKTLPGLEALTGADLLIAIDNPPDDVRELASDEWINTVVTLSWHGYGPRDIARMAERPLPFVLKTLKFLRACKSGLLVQRKSGRDLVSSVPRFSEILFRMQDWTDRPWLLFVGALHCNKSGKAVVDGKSTNWDHNAVQGALEAWQMRGGYVTFLSRDQLVLPWCARWLDKLRVITSDPEKVAYKSRVQVVQGLDDDEGRRVAILAQLRHIGNEKAVTLLDHYGTLANALTAVLDPRFVVDKDRPKGFGKATVVENRRLFGLNRDDMRLVIEKGRK